jgi:hypothetical protein
MLAANIRNAAPLLASSARQTAPSRAFAANASAANATTDNTIVNARSSLRLAVA